MRLVEYQVTNYRSINDSGWIAVNQRTALVGRNESGKSNLLLALASLNPPGGMKALSKVKDFPRDRPRSAFSEDLKVVRAKFELCEKEQCELGNLLPRAKNIAHVIVSRAYKPQTRWIEFVGLGALAVDKELVTSRLSTIQKSVRASSRFRDAATKECVSTALEALATAVQSNQDPEEWADGVGSHLKQFETSLEACGVDPTESVKTSLQAMKDHASHIENDGDRQKQARSWVVRQLPVFIYLSDYPELPGSQEIPQFLDHVESEETTESDNNFSRLMKVANLDPQQLHALLDEDPEERQLQAHLAGVAVTNTIKELWTDRKLKIEFSLDGPNFSTLVSEPESEHGTVVNFDERSRGFKWFFSFYIAFAADTKGGPAANAILLLDEPGLHLHATAQRDLLEHFERNFAENQIIYTTHSPFMVPTHELEAVRTVNFDRAKGTLVTNEPTGDSRTLFPIQAALGYKITQTLFVGERNLIVEGVTDFWYLNSISEYLREIGGTSLPEDLTLTPGGGGQKVPYMVSLLTAESLKVLVLLDYENNAQNTANKLIEDHLIRDENLIFVIEGFSGNKPSAADIEDLLDSDVFDALVRESYAEELKAVNLDLNLNLPRIVKRYELAFRAAGLEFNKSRVARLFIRRMAEDANAALPADSQLRFETLFGVITSRLEKLRVSDRAPFR